MSQEMSFAQALTEARQIIVQQSGRIKSDLEKIKSLQDTVAQQRSVISEGERAAREQTTEIGRQAEEITSLTARLGDANTALEQAEAINDRQGQRLSQMQTAVADFEGQIAQQLDRVNQLTVEIDGLKTQVPSQEDEEALAALATLLATKKAGAPAASGGKSMRISPDTQHAEAA